MSKDYDKVYEDSRHIKDLLETPGWAILKSDIERELAETKREEKELTENLSKLIEKGQTSEQVVIKIGGLQARAKGLSYIFETIDGWDKRGRQAQNEL